MIYSFDTGPFVEFNKGMPIDICVSLWAKFDEMGKDGTLVVSEEVKVELDEGHTDDPARVWLSERPDLIVPSGEVQDIQASILRDHPTLVDPEQTRSNHADPFVIAVAEFKGAAVVATEAHKNKGAPWDKIPDVCKARGIPYYRHLDFLRKQGIKL